RGPEGREGRDRPPRPRLPAAEGRGVPSAAGLGDRGLGALALPTRGARAARPRRGGGGRRRRDPLPRGPGGGHEPHERARPGRERHGGLTGAPGPGCLQAPLGPLGRVGWSLLAPLGPLGRVRWSLLAPLGPLGRVGWSLLAPLGPLGRVGWSLLAPLGPLGL